jgi:hypothetical protein
LPLLLLLLLLLYLWLQARVGGERSSVCHHLLHSHQLAAADSLPDVPRCRAAERHASGDVDGIQHCCFHGVVAGMFTYLVFTFRICMPTGILICSCCEIMRQHWCLALFCSYVWDHISLPDLLRCSAAVRHA